MEKYVRSYLQDRRGDIIKVFTAAFCASRLTALDVRASNVEHWLHLFMQYVTLGGNADMPCVVNSHQMLLPTMLCWCDNRCFAELTVKFARISKSIFNVINI